MQDPEPFGAADTGLYGDATFRDPKVISHLNRLVGSCVSIVKAMNLLASNALRFMKPQPSVKHWSLSDSGKLVGYMYVNHI